VIGCHVSSSGDGSGLAAREAGCPCPILDTHTLSMEQSIKKYFIKKTSRKLYSRVMLGLLLPGRYYFLTLTSSPDSPNLEHSFFLFKKWLRYRRKGITFIFCMTSEGYGVLHMVIRLKPRMKNLDIKDVRDYWVSVHKAQQIKLVRVRHANKLANYLSDQRKKRKLGSEMSWQDLMVRWRASPGWLPKGYGKVFGRLWVEWIDAPEQVRNKVVRESIKEAHKNG